jgi:pyridoxamine 5'-phosphate oxidase
VNTSIDLADLRQDYQTRGLRRSELDPDPMKEFATWFGEAAAADIRDVNAMTLATVDAKGMPQSRIVLLKAISDRGFVFYTNYTSAKARELEANPRAALNFFWVQFARQIRINGTVEKTSREESAEYFHSRPIGSQLGAWASQQSEVIESRDALEAKLAEARNQFGSGEIPLPDFWGGYRLNPETIEFWQGRTNRLHDRFRYRRDGDAWMIERLSP